jgi:hypothetical protein
LESGRKVGSDHSAPYVGGNGRGDVMIMHADAEPRQRMPIRLPGADQVRRRIAEVAAQLSEDSTDHYLSLLGAIEPVSAQAGSNGSAWRLSAYYGSYAETDAIEQAVQLVQRIYPLVRA